MATGLGNKLTGQIGEFLVCAELGRRGLIATPFAGNVPGFDILATDGNYRSVPIQVKANAGNRSWQFIATTFLDIDFDEPTGIQTIKGILRPTKPDLVHVFVWLKNRREESDRFFLLTMEDLAGLINDKHGSYLAKHSGRRPVRPDSYHTAIHLEHLEPWEDNWELIERQLST